MASKEATIYIIDVGPSLKTKREGSDVSRFEETKKVLLKLLANKVHMNRKTVYVSVILVGSDVTNNDLATKDDDGEEYQHVDVLQPLGVATVDLMKGVQNDVELGEHAGDCMDALIVALDMMTKFCKKLKYEKKIYILTDSHSEMNTDGSEQITTALHDDNVQLNVIGTDYDVEEGENKPKTAMQAQNEAFFKALCEESGGDVFSLDEAQGLTSQFYSKKVKPAAVYRGTLNLGDSEKFPDASLAIPVHMYGRTMQAKIPTTKKFSVLSESAAEDNLPGGRTGMVNASRTYKLKVAGDMAAQEMEEDTEVPEDALEKAFMYGKTIVPIRAVDMEALKLSTVKSLTILGFFASSTFQREWLVSNVYSVFAAPGNPRAEVEMAGLVFALFEKNSFALCRYVRINDSEPKLGVLWPEISSEHKCLFFARTAFNEDIRRHVFSSLTDIETVTGKKLEKHRLLATKEMIDNTKEFINALDLMNINDGEEYLAPETTFNPALQRHMQLVEFRALNPTKALPPIPNALIKQLLPLPELAAAAQPIEDTLIRLWDIKKLDKPSSGKRGYRASLDDELGKDGAAEDHEHGSGDLLFEGLSSNPHGNKRQKSESMFGTATSGSAPGDPGASGVAKAGSVFGAGSTLNRGGALGDAVASGMISFEMSAVREIGTSDPVKDFEAMVKIATIQQQQGVRPAGAGFVTVTMAVDQMKAMIQKVITTSFGDQFYEKAIECLKSLRGFLSSMDMAKYGAAAGVESEAEQKEAAKGRVETWNVFIKEVKQMCLNTSISPVRTDFWELVVKNKKDLGLLTKREVPEGAGGVSAEEAEQFMTETTEDTSAPAVDEEAPAPDEDDLLALMD
ncbi:ATP-dependent DNA helicase II subunit 2 [Mortierella hygrophila]|uniref:ATP-dependent DNA helicase II subunit 2 n=1 Tax=Mortierella hygrophila TaxID=979708 RepID=A0A9P6FAL6_9FUNG|nr:ATP-dependent DNA helicase II subunit 2 [Mortierella hygrophila]